MPLPSGVISAAILLLATCAGTALALDEAAYGVAKEPWAEGLGNHRAVVHVEQKADAVLVRIPWRRRDHDPERKQILIVDAATGQGITNIVPLRLDRFEGTLAFQPQTAPGDYYVYYLPFMPQAGWGSYEKDYVRPRETKSEWKDHLPANTDALPRATVVRLEARTEFDSFYPMEVVASEEETKSLLDRNPAPYLVFPEDRRFPIRMTDDLPLRWAKSGPAREFRSEAQRNEFYVFQIGVWAARTNLLGLDVEFKGEMASWLNCFNTGGTNWDGKPFHKTLSVAEGKVQALWIGVNVPLRAAPGEHRAIVTVRPTNAPPATVQLVLKVLPEELADRGDSDLWRLARLRWLDSTLGIDEEPTASYSPLIVAGRSVSCSGFRVTFGQSQSQVCQMPSELSWGGREILSGQVGLFVDGDDDSHRSPRSALLGSLPPSGTGRARLISGHRYRDFEVRSEATVDYDGTLSFSARLSGIKDFKTTNLRLEIPLRPEVATYFMGIGLWACRTPTNYTGSGRGHTTAFGSATRTPACT